MKRNEFIKKYNIEGDYEEWFLTKRIFVLDLKTMGWKLIKCKSMFEVYNKFGGNIICTNPNFYTDGNIIAESRKSLIMASGMKKFSYDGKVYDTLEDLFKAEGDGVLKHIEKWEWQEVMDWIIVNKKSGRLLAQFDNLDDCPERKDVEKK